MTDPHLHPEPSTADAVARVAPSVWCIGSRRHGWASACLWQPGRAATTASALGRSRTPRLQGADGATLQARLVGIDAATDLALLAVDAGDAPVAPRPPHAGARVGDPVFAVGREPDGLMHASFGRIGAVGPAWRSAHGGLVDALIRLDGGLYPGLAGAPVADAQGRVIGIASPAFSRHHGVVLPAATVDRVLEELSVHGRVRRAHLGIAAQPVQLPAAPDSAGGRSRALLVSGLAEGGPAERAGVLVGDLLLSAGGRAVADIDTLRAALDATPIGSTLALELLRGGQPVALAVEVGEPQRSGCR